MIYACSNCRKISRCRSCLKCTIKTSWYCSKTCRVQHLDIHTRICGETYDIGMNDSDTLRRICTILAPIVLENIDDDVLIDLIGLLLSDYSRSEFQRLDDVYHPQIENILLYRFQIIPDEWNEYLTYSHELRFKRMLAPFRFSGY
jgi:hypothetical protein